MAIGVSELGSLLLAFGSDLLHEPHELGWERLIHPAVDECLGLTIDGLLQTGVVTSGIHELLAVDESASISGQKLCQGRNLGDIRPKVFVVQVSDDAVDEATVCSLLGRDWLVKHEDLSGAPLSELLDKSHGAATLRRLTRLHERCAELGLWGTIDEVKERASGEANANGLATNKTDDRLLGLQD